jgi:serpin B
MKKQPRAVMLSLISTLVYGCGSDAGGDTKTGSNRDVTQLTTALGPVVSGHNAFALELYQDAATHGDGNLFISPLSIEAALAITERGAAGETAEEFKQLLHIGKNEASYHREFGRLLRDLSGSHAGRSYELNLANGLFVADDFTPKAEFSSQVDADYAAEVSSVDFAKTEALTQVNDWVKAKTQGLVPKLFDSFAPNTVLAITNAIYFKGNWASGFDPKWTSDVGFKLSAEQTKLMPTMYSKAEFRCSGDERVRVVELDYEGHDLSMVILVPGDATDLTAPSVYAPLQELEAELDKSHLDDWLGALSPCEVKLFLPQFKAESSLDLRATLMRLGIEQAFDSGKADFSRLSDKQLFVDQALHRAYVKVDESGTRAAAATAVVLATKSAKVEPSIAVDQPFVFLIRDKLTDAILFMGRITDPTAAD